MQHLEKKIFTADEYFDMEETAEYNSEYYHGEIFAMTGGSFDHNVIVSHMITALNNALHDRDCYVLASDIKIEIDPAHHYVYPDISVVCGRPDFVKNRKDIITNPLVIVEVLSSSTSEYDRGDKFRAYRGIPCLKNYIIVDQYACHVQCCFKENEGKWLFQDFETMEDSFLIQSLDIRIYLKDIYHRINFNG